MLKNKKTLFIGIILCLLFVITVLFGGNIKLQDSDLQDGMVNKDESDNNYIDLIIDDENEDVTEGDTEEAEDNITEGNTEQNYYLYDEETEAEITSIIDSMTLEEKVGQLFFVKNDNRFDESILDEYSFGGIIIFASDCKGETKESLTNKIDLFCQKSKYPLFIGIDEEGGTVTRLSQYRALSEKKFQSPRQVYASGGMDAIKEDTIEKSELLLSYGINVNFAPVADVTQKSSQYMYQRSFSGDAIEVAEYIDLVVTTMNEEKIGSVVKHFPGYGGNGDTHKNVIHDKRKYEEFEESDFIPFNAAIQAGAQCILISHNVVECIDEENPASLSYKVHDLLRNELGFNGVIITDDLMMDGVSNYVSAKDSAVMSILAGNDMILSTDYKVQYQAVLDAVSEGRIDEERIEESVRRILRWKKHIGIM